MIALLSAHTISASGNSPGLPALGGQKLEAKIIARKQVAMDDASVTVGFESDDCDKEPGANLQPTELGSQN